MSESCKAPENKKAYVAIYNYGIHGDASFGYAEIIIPVPSAKTHSPHNDSDYPVNHYVQGAELLTRQDFFPLMYVPRKLGNQFFNLTQKTIESGEYSSYIYLFHEPFNWSSLSKMDSILRQNVNDVSEIRYFDTAGRRQVLRDIVFEMPHYFFDGKEVSDTSAKFVQEMYIEQPPRIVR